MKLSDFAKQLGVSELKIREYSKEIGKEIPENKSVLNKALAKEIEDGLKEGVRDEGRGTEKIVNDKKKINKNVETENLLSKIDNKKEEVEVKVEKPLSDKDDGKSVDAEGDVLQTGVPVKPIMTVKSFSEAVKLPVTKVIMQLANDGFMANINEKIDFDIMELLSDELEVDIYLDDSVSEIEKHLDMDLAKLMEIDKKNGVTRAPVVSVIGHVDHGKTSLLDAIRKTSVVSGEAGSITQSIGAYQVDIDGQPITFIDTPGHEAFIAMRRRGVHITDIAILAVSSNEGVKPQTKEAISHAKDAGVPIIVAITKVDLEDANVEKVKTELSELELIPEEWGGDTIMVETSKNDKSTLDKLLESILLMAEMLELKADSTRTAIGSVIEANVDKKIGNVASVLIHTGTLNCRDIITIGGTYGKVRTLTNDCSVKVQSATPSMPVQITGLSKAPFVGDILKVVKTEKEAKKLTALFARESAKRSEAESLTSEVITNKEKDFKGIQIILKVDTKGSKEAIIDALAKVKTEHAYIKVVRSDVGSISQSNVLLANAVKSYVVSFGVGYSSLEVEQEARRRGVKVYQFNIIYKLVEDLTQLMLSSLEAEYEDIDSGTLTVKQVFLTKKKFMIVGGKVEEGMIEINSSVRVMRGEGEEQEQVGVGNITGLQKGPSKVGRVAVDEECGVTYEGNVKLVEGDVLQFYKTVEKKVVLQ